MQERISVVSGKGRKIIILTERYFRSLPERAQKEPRPSCLPQDTPGAASSSQNSKKVNIVKARTPYFFFITFPFWSK